MLKIRIDTRSKSYPVYVGDHLLSRMGPVLKSHLDARVILVVSDAHVAHLYADRCRKTLQQAGFGVELAEIEGGEPHKSLDAATRLYDLAIAAGLHRSDAVLALGGGITGDLAGFVAATYLRGISFVQVPTTLLAMVDSSVGGKVAVNHRRGKNLIGAFYQPDAVFADTTVLHTLPEREFYAGLAEVVKCGLIGDPGLFFRLEALSQHGGTGAKKRLDPSGLLIKKLIARAVLLKRDVVCRDETEEGLRRVLNLGHTFGHALESSTGYTHYLHGEAVAWGLALASRLARRLNLLHDRDEQRIIRIVRWLDPPAAPGSLSRDSLLGALQYDKKREGVDSIFVLPVKIGRVSFFRSPPLDTIRATFDDFLQGRLL